MEAHTSDLVMLEMTQPMRELATRGLLQVEHLDVSGMLALREFQTRRPRSLSFEDCSVLSLAIEMEAALLTGDANLRKAAENEDVEVHGLLELLNHGCPFLRLQVEESKEKDTRIMPSAKQGILGISLVFAGSADPTRHHSVPGMLTQ